MVREAFRRAVTSRHVPIYRSSYALMLTTVLNGALGLLFWVSAARLYPADVVGLGAGGISALQLVATVGWVGLQFTLLRYVPLAGVQSRRLVTAVYVVGVGIALLAAALFTLALARQLDVPYVSDGPVNTVIFWASVAVWVAFTLQDSVLIGLRRAGWVPWANSLYGALKLILLVALSAIAEPWTLLGVWVGGAAVFVAIVSGLLFLRVLPAVRDPASIPGASAIARYTMGHTGVAFIALAPDFLVSLLVLTYLDADANAYYYAAWTVGISARLLAVSLANALIVEAAYAQETVTQLLRAVIRLCVAVLVPVGILLIVGADYILRIFGPEYAENGAVLLRYVAVSLVPFTVVTLIVALDRVRERFGAAILITFVGTGTVILLDVLLIPEKGIEGAGIGWLGGQTLAAIVALVLLRRESPSAWLPSEADRVALAQDSSHIN